MDGDTKTKTTGSRRSFLRLLRAGLIAVSLLAMVGCNDGGSDNKDSSNNDMPAPPLVDLNGVWNLTFDNGVVVAMYFDHNGTSVQGVGQDQNGAPYSFAGTLEDKTLKGTLLPWEAELKAKVEATAMGGTYKTPTATGAFTGNRE